MCDNSLASVQCSDNKLKMTKFLDRFHQVEVSQDESDLRSTGTIIIVAIMRSLKEV
jgi:hypothetical protein